MTKIAYFSPFREGCVEVAEVPSVVPANIGVILLINYIGKVPKSIPNGRYATADFEARLRLSEIEEEIYHLKMSR